MQFFVLGIDTSNYTTSIALIDQNRNVLIDNRKTLDVKKGQRGLRQSEALFQHVLNMPNLFEDAISLSVRDKIKVISVSSKPRPMEDSYMPVFLAARSYGQVLAHILQCEYMEFSHQENHIEAAKWSSDIFDADNFIGVHISGGTTEILLVEKMHSQYKIEIIGGSLDISAGQLIDRLGVKLGYPFPAGKCLDNIAMESDHLIRLPIAINRTFFNFSGLETKAYQLIDTKYSEKEIVKSIMHSIAQTLSVSLKNACIDFNVNKVLCFGGVAASSYIREYLTKFAKEYGLHIFFGENKYCTDNGVGTALLPLSFMKKEGL